MQPHLLHELLAFQAHRNPAATALWWLGGEISYGSLYDRVETLARRLAATGRAGDRIAVLARNSPQFVELIYAASASGRILVPLNCRLAAAEWIFQLRKAGVQLLFGDQELLDSLREHVDCPQAIELVPLGTDTDKWLADGPAAELPEIRENDPAWILYTSGSTGRPKGAVLSHRSFMAGLESAALGRPVLPGDRYLYPFPLFHVAAHNVLLQHRHGAAVALVRSFEAGETLRLCQELHITTLSLAPTMIAMLLDHPEFDPGMLASVRTIGYGASAMPQTLLQRMLSLTDIGLCQSYGMTELSGSVSFLTVDDHKLAAQHQPELLKSVGKPLPTARVRLLDDSGRDSQAGKPGEILVRATQCMTGYWEDASATAAVLTDGWLHTGDIGRFDDAGYLHLVDRKKDMIISGGENIASREVEETLCGHPSVIDCAALGIPNPKWGEVICAVIRLRQATTDEELDRYCRHRLAGYKTPRHWLRLDSLPVNAGGKIDKPKLREIAARHFA